MRSLKFRLGLRLKITAYISVLIIFTSTVLGWFLVKREAEEFIQHLKDKGTVIASSVASASELGVLIGDKRIFKNIIAGLNQGTDVNDVVYCIIYDAKGARLDSTKTRPHHIEGISPLADAEVTEKALRTERPLIQSFTRDERKTPVFDIAAPIMTHKTPELTGEALIFGIGEDSPSEGVIEKIGVARIGISLEPMNEEIKRAGRTIRKITALVVMRAIGITVFLVRLIVNPVQQLVAATERVASGDLDKPVEIGTNDEIGELGVSFNKMTEDLKRYRDEIS